MDLSEIADFQVSFRPKQEEFAEVENWLRLEEHETEDGFYCNLHLLRNSFTKGEMVVATLKEKAVGFLTWHQNSEFGAYINIAEIRPDLRGHGLGRKLVSAGFRHFRKIGLIVVDLECAPANSEGFWRKMGFLEFPKSSHGWRFQIGGHKRLYRTLVDTLEPTNSTSPADEVFELWNDEAHLMRNAEPSWIWKLEFRNGTRELVKPIVHAAAPEWRARWRKGDEVFKDGPVKRLLPWENITGSFVMVTEMPRG